MSTASRPDDTPASTPYPPNPTALHRRLARCAVRQAAARYEQAKTDLEQVVEAIDQYVDARRARGDLDSDSPQAESARSLRMNAHGAVQETRVALIEAILLASGKVDRPESFHAGWPPCGVAFDGVYYIATPYDHPDEPATQENESFSPSCAGLAIVAMDDIEQISHDMMTGDTRDDEQEFPIMTAKTRPPINGATKAPATPLPPACTSKHVAALARWELREAIDGYLSARERQANAQEWIAALDPVAAATEITLIRALAERAEMTIDLARTATAEALLLAWGFAPDYDHARGNEPTPPWTPIGCHVDGEHVAWIKPSELDGKPNYNAMFAELTVVALEDLPTDGAEDRLLESPPCPLLRLHRHDLARVIPAGKPA